MPSVLRKKGFWANEDQFPQGVPLADKGLYSRILYGVKKFI
jgi:hypothetical protein